MPAWLRSLEPSGPAVPAAGAAVVLPVEGPTPIEAEPSDLPAAILPADADIPNWMRDAGWKESTGAAVEGPVTFSDDELSAVGPQPRRRPRTSCNRRTSRVAADAAPAREATIRRARHSAGAGPCNGGPPRLARGIRVGGGTMTAATRKPPHQPRSARVSAPVRGRVGSRAAN
jgi:hypothetical protein